jgi:hypothetical protein
MALQSDVKPRRIGLRRRAYERATPAMKKQVDASSYTIPRDTTPSAGSASQAAISAQPNTLIRRFFSSVGWFVEKALSCRLSMIFLHRKAIFFNHHHP